MRLSIDYEMNSGLVSLDYRSGLISLVKNATSTLNQNTYKQHKSWHKFKPLFLSKYCFQYIEIKNKILLNNSITPKNLNNSM